ncbi:unnamed protein product, partial [Cuscuta europaea]
MLTDDGEPQSYKEAINDIHKEEWRKVMQEEMQPLHENHICELVELPKVGVGTRWNRTGIRLFRSQTRFRITGQNVIPLLSLLNRYRNRTGRFGTSQKIAAKKIQLQKE